MLDRKPSHVSSFAADVLKLVSGTTFAQVVTILASPLLTRLYGPEAFGFLALFTSITSIIGVIACMPLASSRSYSRRLTKTANLLGLCLLRVAVVSRLTVPALYFGGDAVRSLHGAPGPGSYFILVSPFVFAGWCFLR